MSLDNNISNVTEYILKNDKKVHCWLLWRGQLWNSGKHGGIQAIIKEEYDCEHIVIEHPLRRYAANTEDFAFVTPASFILVDLILNCEL